MPATQQDRIPITSSADLANHLRDIALALEEPETEHSWNRLDKALFRLEAIAKGGAYKYDEFVPFMKTVARPLCSSLLSERTRLSGTAADVLTSVAPRLADRFDTLVPVYVPALLQLCARTNKVALKRAQKCLHVMVKVCRLPSLLPHLREASKDKFVTLRSVAVECITLLVDAAGRDRLNRKVADVEAIVRATATDTSAEVRQGCKRLFEAYVNTWPERVESFTAPFTPTIRRYLALPKTGGLKVDPSLIAAAAEAESSSRATRAQQQPQPQPARRAKAERAPVPEPAFDDDYQHQHQQRQPQMHAQQPHAPYPHPQPPRPMRVNTAPEPADHHRSNFLEQLAAAKNRPRVQTQVQSTGALRSLNAAAMFGHAQPEQPPPQQTYQPPSQHLQHQQRPPAASRAATDDEVHRWMSASASTSAAATLAAHAERERGFPGVPNLPPSRSTAALKSSTSTSGAAQSLQRSLGLGLANNSNKRPRDREPDAEEWLAPVPHGLPALSSAPALHAQHGEQLGRSLSSSHPPPQQQHFQAPVTRSASGSSSGSGSGREREREREEKRVKTAPATPAVQASQETDIQGPTSAPPAPPAGPSCSDEGSPGYNNQVDPRFDAEEEAFAEALLQPQSVGGSAAPSEGVARRLERLVREQREKEMQRAEVVTSEEEIEMPHAPAFTAARTPGPVGKTPGRKAMRVPVPAPTPAPAPSAPQRPPQTAQRVVTASASHADAAPTAKEAKEGPASATTMATATAKKRAALAAASPSRKKKADAPAMVTARSKTKQTSSTTQSLGAKAKALGGAKPAVVAPKARAASKPAAATEAPAAPAPAPKPTAAKAPAAAPRKPTAGPSTSTRAPASASTSTSARAPSASSTSTRAPSTSAPASSSAPAAPSAAAQRRLASQQAREAMLAKKAADVAKKQAEAAAMRAASKARAEKAAVVEREAVQAKRGRVGAGKTMAGMGAQGVKAQVLGNGGAKGKAAGVGAGAGKTKAKGAQREQEQQHEAEDTHEEAHDAEQGQRSATPTPQYEQGEAQEQAAEVEAEAEAGAQPPPRTPSPHRRDHQAHAPASSPETQLHATRTPFEPVSPRRARGGGGMSSPLRGGDEPHPGLSPADRLRRRLDDTERDGAYTPIESGPMRRSPVKGRVATPVPAHVLARGGAEADADAEEDGYGYDAEDGENVPPQAQPQQQHTPARPRKVLGSSTKFGTGTGGMDSAASSTAGSPANDVLLLRPRVRGLNGEHTRARTRSHPHQLQMQLVLGKPEDVDGAESGAETDNDVMEVSGGDWAGTVRERAVREVRSSPLRGEYAV